MRGIRAGQGGKTLPQAANWFRWLKAARGCRS